MAEISSAARPTHTVSIFAGLLVLMGLIARIAPLFDQDGRMLAQWPTEDGYFMLTMARNIAIGNGLSVSDGTVPTNGTQPLTTFIWSTAYMFVGGDKTSGVFIVLIYELIASLIALALVHALYRRVLWLRRDGESIAAIAAGAWFATPIVTEHAMNCLETGVYAAFVAGVLLFFTEKEEGTPPLWSIARCLAGGFLLGATFWARNDGAFLILAVCITYAFREWQAGTDVIRARLGRAILFGATSVAVASPWLIYNYLYFGHIMPVSGRAEALTGHLFGNVTSIPPVLLEYMIALPIPNGLQGRSIVQLITLGIVLAIVGAVFAVRSKFDAVEGRFVWIASIYLGALCAFYGIYFGAKWFLPRYFMPASSILFLLWGLVAYRLYEWVRERFGAVALALPAILAALFFAINVRHYGGGNVHQHFHVIEWVRENVPDETWMGAIQTGTLGYFHDRTVNLDGKVNPEAYDALVSNTQGEYVANSQIDVLADWIGLADWRDKPAFTAAFELVVESPERNLAVWRRVRPRSGGADPAPLGASGRSSDAPTGPSDIHDASSDAQGDPSLATMH